MSTSTGECQQLIFGNGIQRVPGPRHVVAIIFLGSITEKDVVLLLYLHVSCMQHKKDELS